MANNKNKPPIMNDKRYISALKVNDVDYQLYPGDTIKIYDQETTITGFSASYNDALNKWETIIHTVGRGDPFERSLDVIELLEEQPRSFAERDAAVCTTPESFYTTGFEQGVEAERKRGKGMRWVKAVAKDKLLLPARNLEKVLIRYNKERDRILGNADEIRELCTDGWDDIEWLDEGSTEQSGKDEDIDLIERVLQRWAGKSETIHTGDGDFEIIVRKKRD